jgi:signal transduction histidine kinase
VLRRVFGVDVGLRVAGAPRLDPEAEGEVFRIAQEALQNALRHAHAGRVEVRLEAENGRVGLAVADDGIGFEAENRELRGRRLGLTSMEERARAVGGVLTIESSPGAGTTVRLEVGG